LVAIVFDSIIEERTEGSDDGEVVEIDNRTGRFGGPMRIKCELSPSLRGGFQAGNPRSKARSSSRENKIAGSGGRENLVSRGKGQVQICPVRLVRCCFAPVRETAERKTGVGSMLEEKAE
jgi:hypothetical protein